MTDKQREIFQKMIEGVCYKSSDSDYHYYVKLSNGWIQGIGKRNLDWADYEKAWKAYESLPLMKALL